MSAIIRSVRVSTKTRYGVRAIFDIAFHCDGGPAQAKDIARRQKIPQRYLEQIFQELKRARLVDAKRGPRGGYSLRSQPAQITLGDIVRALQGSIEEMFVSDISQVEDPPGDGTGEATSKEVTSAMFRELAAEMKTWFDSKTVADLLERAVDLGIRQHEGDRAMYYI